MAEWTTDEINKLLQDVHSGKTHLFNLPKIVYNRVGEELTSAVFEAFNLDADTNLLNPDFETARQLKRNCYVFSAAKTFQQVKDMQNFLFDDKGFKRPFNDFNKAAEGIFNTYNRTWLEAEYETALSQAESASEWERIQAEKDIFPLLRYKTIEDGSVRQEHKTLNNVVRPVDDPFWSRYTPPNGWRCRCFLEQLEEDEAAITEVVEQNGKTYRRNRRWLQEVEQPTKLFDFNPAEKGVIFRDDAQGKGLSHPYFKVDQRWDVHKLRNFGLPLPPDVKDLQPLKTIGKQKVKTTTAKPNTLETTPVETTKTIPELNKPKTYEEVVGEGAAMPSGFWNLLSEPLDGFRKAKRGEGSYMQGNKVVIDVDRSNTDIKKKLIVAHEVGHAVHEQRQWVTPSLSGKPKTHKIFDEVFDKWRENFGLGARGNKRREIAQEILNKISLESRKRLQKKYNIDDSLSAEYWAKVLDTVGSLTNGRLGGGHTANYYMQLNGWGSRAEFFAHAMENTFVGNPYFKELFPELYEDTIKMIKDLTKTTR